DSQGQVSAPSQELAGVAGGSSPLAISCPAPSATSTDGDPVTLSLAPSVTGGLQPVTTVFSPPSGTAFPVGTTAISCVANDATQTTVSCSSTATVVYALAPP